MPTRRDNNAQTTKLDFSNPVQSRQVHRAGERGVAAYPGKVNDAVVAVTHKSYALWMRGRMGERCAPPPNGELRLLRSRRVAMVSGR